MTETKAGLDAERATLLETLALHRSFLRQTAQGLTDEQGLQRSTVSALCISGLIKHVSETERRWVNFLVEGPSALPSWTDPAQADEHAAEFVPAEGEGLAALLAQYEQVAHRTEEVVRSLADLDTAQQLPEAPWWPEPISWSGRRVLLHILAETAQHAGHADIIRESIDGAKTMG